MQLPAMDVREGQGLMVINGKSLSTTSLANGGGINVSTARQLGCAVFYLDVLASVTDIEIRETSYPGDRDDPTYHQWEVVAFAGEEEEEVDVPELHRLSRQSYRTAREAQTAVQGALRNGPTPTIHVIPLEE